MRIIEALSTMLIDDLLASSSHNHSKVKIQCMKQQSNKSTTLEEKSIKVELEDYYVNLAWLVMRWLVIVVA